MKIKTGTIVRTVVLIITLANTVLSGMGISILYFIPSIILGIAGVPSYAINLIWTLPFALAAWLICRWVLKKGGRKFETLS